MDLDPDTFKKLKPKIEDDIQKRFQTIESDVDVTIPKGFRNLIDEAFERQYPHSQEEYDNLFLSTHENLTSFIASLRLDGDKLDPTCKDFIDKLIIQLYRETKGKGIENEFWAHIQKIWNLKMVVCDFEKVNPDTFSIEFSLNQTLTVYIQIYESTIHFLTDIARKIATKRRRVDEHSKRFQKLFRKRKLQGMTISRNELCNYFDTQDFMDGWKCGVVQDAYIRNKIAHSDYYYDDDTKKLVFGTKSYDLEELREILETLYSFYCYLILKYIDESNLIHQMDILAQMKGSKN